MNIRKIKIICEEAYVESIWCKQLLSGFTKELKKRRVSHEVSTETEVFEQDAVCLIGMSKDWLEKNITNCNEKQCVPMVLSNVSCRLAKGKYHFIGPDLLEVVKKMKTVFNDANRERIAIYGVNQKSESDGDRAEAFMSVLKNRVDMFPTTGNLEACFRSFLPKVHRYDAVICVNGYVAISLIKKLEKENQSYLDHLVILSFEEVLKHSKYNQWISLIDLNLESYGETAWLLFEMAMSANGISEIDVKMGCVIPQIASKIVSEETAWKDAESHLFEDPEIVHMEKIEQLLQDADDLDHHIIAMLLEGATYGDVADSCYMTEGNVKYRVKKYMSICDCKTKKELLELLQEYLQ